MKLGPSLLGVVANGSRYFIARSERDGNLWLVEERPDGSGGASPLYELSGGSTEPFESWIAAGVPPPGTRSAEVTGLREIQHARFRNGMWLAAVPIRGRGDAGTFTVRFFDADGREIGSCEEEFEIPRRRIQRTSAC